MQFSDYVDDIARATGFLSRLPVPAHYFDGHDGSLSRASGMFPAAGLVIALVPGLLIVLLSWLGANPALTVLIALAVSIALTGGLHEDGLADSADAFGARGGRDHMLEIMKDSRTGTYGVLALVLSLALRATALTILLSVLGGWYTLLGLLAVAAASRAAITWHWNALPPARQDGVAASVGAPEDSAATRSLVTGGIAFTALAALSVGLIPALLSLGVLAACISQWTTIVRKKLHGHTGDTLGASQQIAETACLVTLALLV
ncbi:MAG: adenosylcobinamide-GDP ribazoletransferase [Hoeflea sp.]|uniref:adenosylcobinamide-GDP ribazoletransferase n=1 Tax=Hoeflea sp. TaxID=1940281 RepID=UPI001D99F341|nr:adenosylcobinamide-GDP ribazoletransferase [Hoeflea sp.]MBU4530564.1 adenosylcobinamide-GDP ribazoletransferase [Alphaproteobacteria bacterium]MBU4545351.1 adenosylcobinamide-GDP ribazoletransferase [Alphaproteobacteria bacterium]MBU4549000.1 adenosylcobinamide-GDP ribazoletransferase [Alphaproteobacteria bacterium]MBV1722155.1 adenosylcobinamide-GDP ribazoletransferase [Hoeflea sp.]MBV1761505.1 adenosylcobinamide-GDP ribazoletransferase [Hoeflea sp.]